MMVKIEYALKPVSPIHIGSGLGGGAVKRMLLRRSNGSFSIAGSTIKGRVRYYCREFAREDAFFSPHDVDEVFGMPGDWSSRGTWCAFSDLEGSGDEVVFLKNGIQISRELGIARPHALFNTELIRCHLDFKGTISCQYSEGNEKYIALLVTGLRLLRWLGGSKTVGAGKCEVPLESIHIVRNGDALETTKLLEKYL